MLQIKFMRSKLGENLTENNLFRVFKVFDVKYLKFFKLNTNWWRKKRFLGILGGDLYSFLTRLTWEINMMIRLHPPTTPLPFSARCFHVDLHLVSLVTAATFLRRLERGRKTILPTCSAQKTAVKVFMVILASCPRCPVVTTIFQLLQYL